MSKEGNVAAAARAFEIGGEFLEARPYGSGHINDTYKVFFNEGGVPQCHILQRINHNIFKKPVALMENIQRVTAHIATRVADEPDWQRRVLRLIPARDGRDWRVDAEGNHWRAYYFIHAVESTGQAFQAARAFGRFQELLASLPAPRLHDTIPDFNHAPKRFKAFEDAVAADVAGRAILVKHEIDFALARKSITGVLLDDTTGEGICVIDLDTVMPGLAPYDFGDMVRTTTSPAMEDEQDLSKVTMQFPMFEALVRGYLSSAGGFLTPAEKDLLAFSGKLITFELGIRFLTDYLAGDTYFKVHRDGHNLDRCRTQFKLIQSIEQQEESMNRLVETLAS